MVFHKIFHFPFDEAKDSATLNKIKQDIHILKESKVIQLEQIQEQCEMINLMRVETAKTSEKIRLITTTMLASLLC